MRAGSTAHQRRVNERPVKARAGPPNASPQIARKPQISAAAQKHLRSAISDYIAKIWEGIQLYVRVRRLGATSRPGRVRDRGSVRGVSLKSVSGLNAVTLGE
jgi:hypothetical protein